MPATTVPDDATVSPEAPDRRPPLEYASNKDAPTPPPLLSDRLLAFVDRHRRWVLLLILGLYSAGFNGQWRLEPDSALYLSIGRNLVEGHGYTYHGKDHRLAYPGVPLLFAGLFKTFGADTLLPHLIVMWLMGLATLGLTYRLFLLHAGRPTAVLITLGVALSRIVYRYSFELLTDLPFLLGVMAFFVGYEAVFYRRVKEPRLSASGLDEPLASPPLPDARGALTLSDVDAVDATEDDSPARRPLWPLWYDSVLLVLGLAIAVATRPSMWALVAAAGLAMIWSLIRGRARWGHFFVATMVVMAVGLFYLKDPRQQSSSTTAPASITYAEEDQLFHLKADKLATMANTAMRNLPRLLEQGLERATFGSSIVPGLNSLLALALAVAGVMLVRTRPIWGMWVLATLMMVLLVPRGATTDRYFLPIVPVLVYAWWTLARGVERRLRNRRRTAGFVFLILFGLGGLPNVLELCGFVFEQRYRPFLAYYKKGRYASAQEVAKLVEMHTPPSGAALDPKTTWVCTPEKFGRITTFLSRRYCVEPDPYMVSVRPAEQLNVFVLEPTEPAHSEPVRPETEGRRVAVDEWLGRKGYQVVPAAIAGPVPNKDPDDPRPWTLHRIMPIIAAPESR